MKIADVKRDWKACERDPRWLGNNSCKGNCSSCANLTITYEDGTIKKASEGSDD